MDTKLINCAQDQTEPTRTRRPIADIICEFLEVAFNLVLYTRGVYPDGIFKKRQKYNISVMMSVHPGLNEYIKDVLVGIRSLICLGNIERITLEITKEEKPIERYVFELMLFDAVKRDTDNDNWNLPQQLRDLLLKIHTSDAVLKPLPSDCSFIVTVQTKDSVANELVNCEHFEGFPWVRLDQNTSDALPNTAAIFPLKSCSFQQFDMQCFVEINFNNKA